MKRPIKKFKGYELAWFTDKELADLFHDGLDEVLAIKIPEVKEIIKDMETDISKKLKVIEDTDTDDFTKWFCREIVGMKLLPKVLPYDSELFQLSKYAQILNPTTGKHISNFQERLAIARSREIVDVVSRYVELRQSGERFSGLCPFHEDRKPSFTVYPQQGRYFCYGCQKSGDVINFIQEIQNVEFKDAVNFLQN